MKIKNLRLSFVSSLVVSILFLAIGCQHQPTKMTVQEPLQIGSVTVEKLNQAEAVILDVRAPFEYNIAHAPGAINIRWEDISQQGRGLKGLLISDSFSIARRLALIGIDPNTTVIVIGKGHQGHGEEGRIAWTLNYLGVKNVFTLVDSAYRKANTNPLKLAPPVKNKPVWKPVVVDSLLVKKDEFNRLAQVATVIIDVRSKQEFTLPDNIRKNWKNVILHNIPWNDFYDAKGMISKSIVPILQALGVTTETEIIFISNNGVRSGSATYALNNLGFKKVRNFAGGYHQLN